ncbi:phosphotransferase family enzyme [Tamaricihabitans halophyticus]|uniref:Phosphotransferase family enzyme n=2 Tax=Tamaricihabitans halophyticus TaxID=1262583 RepID=A0A4R2QMY4_9PSEU|nr:phosphotransferase family enzyme [Tamaricihabitans halophyticus]
MSTVLGIRLTDARDVVVKARPDENRAVSCVLAQARLADQGLPCAQPLTPVHGVGPLAVHAEEYRAGGTLLRGDSPAVAARYAAVFAQLMAGLAKLTLAPPLPNPRWVRWDHTEPGLWPAIESLDKKDQKRVPSYVTSAAHGSRERMLALAANLPRVLGHADFEAHNLRWDQDRVRVVHDWDSLAWQPEAALVGAASAVFPKMGPATLPPIESTEAFLATYQEARGRWFTADEWQLAWAASVWPAAHDLRWEALHGYPATTAKDFRAQVAERLRRAEPA